MGLIGKIALIGIVAIAVLIAVIWDVQNENRTEEPRTTNAEQIRGELPENITTEETPNPETPQEQSPAAIEQPEQPDETPPAVEPETPETPVEPETPRVEPGPNIPDTPGTGEKYVIQKKDTLFKIAEKFYGNGKLWPAIAAANPDVDPEVLKVGTEITIPPSERVSDRAPAQPLPPAQETYIIQGGDTLTRISRMHYGDDSHTELIFQANRDRLKSKNILQPGTVIVIPPMPEKKDD